MKVSTLYGTWEDISRNRATTGCFHICYFKNIEKAGGGFVNIIDSVPYLQRRVRGVKEVDSWLVELYDDAIAEA